MLEQCERPVMFELTQSRLLLGWTGNTRDPRLKALIDDVAKMVAGGPEPVPASVPVQPPPAQPRLNHRLAIGGSIAALALGGGGFTWWQSRQPSTLVDAAGAAGPATSLKVMPFENQSGDASQAWFGNGMAEEVRSTLAQLPGLKVIGRVSSERFRDAPDLAVAANKIDAAMILTGSVRRGGDTLRVSAQLTEAVTGVERWLHSYDRKSDDMLTIQSEIAASVATALRVRLGSAATDRPAGDTLNAEANELFLRARELAGSAFDEFSQRQKLALYDQALSIDPNFALAWNARGTVLDYLSRIAIQDMVQRQTLFDAASKSIERAVQLAPSSGRAHAGLANQLSARLEMSAPVRECEAAMPLSPRDVVAVGNAGVHLAFVYPERGLAVMQSALPLDPFAYTNMANISRTLLCLGRIDASFAMYKGLFFPTA